MIATRLREILLQRELNYQEPYTVKDVADAANLSYDTVARFKNNQTSRFDAPVLAALCRVLDVQVGDLLVYVPNGDGPSAEPGGG